VFGVGQLQGNRAAIVEFLFGRYSNRQNLTLPEIETGDLLITNSLAILHKRGKQQSLVYALCVDPIANRFEFCGVRKLPARPIELTIPRSRYGERSQGR
jgi:hypothetical protein